MGLFRVPTVYVGIVGTRRRDSEKDKEKVRKALRKLIKRFGIPALHIVSGGCPEGGDRFAEELAKEYGIPYTIYPPRKYELDLELLKTRPRAAYAKINYARNTQIAEASVWLIACVAPDRKGGTEDTVKKFLRHSEKDHLLLV